MEDDQVIGLSFLVAIVVAAMLVFGGKEIAAMLFMAVYAAVLIAYVVFA